MQYTNKSKGVTLIVTLVGTHFVREQQTPRGVRGHAPPEENFLHFIVKCINLVDVNSEQSVLED